MTIDVTRVSGTELYVRYPRQTQRQSCFVEFDPRSGMLRAAADSEIGSGMPMACHHGLLLRWGASPLKADTANALLAEVAPLAERLMTGFAIKWDGNNHVGSLSEDAAAASEQIERLCEEAGDDGALSVMDASDFFGVLGDDEAQARELGITAATTDEELSVIAARELNNADDVDLIECLDEHIERLRQRVRDVAAERDAS